jgi:hypothetical protein
MHGLGLGPYKPTADGMPKLEAEATYSPSRGDGLRRGTRADTLALARALVEDGTMPAAEFERLVAEDCR